MTIAIKMKHLLNKNQKNLNLSSVENSKRCAGGFTLVEMVISVGIFAMVMVTALAIIMSFINDNKKSQAINAVVTNLNFALDSMVRDIKTGYKYDDGLVSDENEITLISTLYNQTTDEKRVTYALQAENGSSPGGILKTSCDVNEDHVVDEFSCITSLITSPEINVTELKFYTDKGVPSSSQPNVFITIKGESAQKDASGGDFTGGAANFTIQTLVTQRVLNI